MRDYTERMEWLNRFAAAADDANQEYPVSKFAVKIFFKHPEDWTDPAPFFLTNEDGRVEFDEFEDAEAKAQEVEDAGNGSVITMVV